MKNITQKIKIMRKKIDKDLVVIQAIERLHNLLIQPTTYFTEDDKKLINKKITNLLNKL